MIFSVPTYGDEWPIKENQQKFTHVLSGFPLNLSKKKDFLMFGYEPDLYFEMAMKQWNKCLLGGIEEPSGIISFKFNLKSVPEGKYLPAYPHTREMVAHD